MQKRMVRIHSRIFVGLIACLFVVLAGCQTAPQGGGERWWKGNWHCHSRWSDGNSFPEMVVKWYAENGYNFLTLSDHHLINQGEMWSDVKKPKKDEEGKGYQQYLATYGPQWVQTRGEGDQMQIRVKPLNEYRHLFERPGKFMLMQGQEISMPWAVHFVGINLVETIDEPNLTTKEEKLLYSLNQVREQRDRSGQRMIVQINHPNWNWALRAEDIAPLKDVRFIEVYNGGGGNIHNFGEGPRVSVERMWDIILTKRLGELGLPLVYGTAADDTHNFFVDHPVKAGQGWVMVRSKVLSSDKILEALESGDFYFSTGVELADIRSDGKKLDVTVQAKKGDEYVIQFIGTRRGYEPAGQVVLDENGREIFTTKKYSDQIGAVLAEVKGTRASYTFKGDELYVRAKVTSNRIKENAVLKGEHEMAWGQPVVAHD